MKEWLKQLRIEAQADYVGLWQVARVLSAENRGLEQVTPSIITEAVDSLIRDGALTIGQFENDTFVEWDGTLTEKLHRLHSELVELGHVPDIGDVAWITAR